MPRARWSADDVKGTSRASQPGSAQGRPAHDCLWAWVRTGNGLGGTHKSSLHSLLLHSRNKLVKTGGNLKPRGQHLLETLEAVCLANGSKASCVSGVSFLLQFTSTINSFIIHWVWFPPQNPGINFRGDSSLGGGCWPEPYLLPKQ